MSASEKDGTEEDVDKTWQALLELDARLHRERHIRLLTPEARVLLCLKTAGPIPVSAAMNAAGTSYRGFYDVLKRLKASGLVGVSKDSGDQRIRRLNVVLPLPRPSTDQN